MQRNVMGEQLEAMKRMQEQMVQVKANPVEPLVVRETTSSVVEVNATKNGTQVEFGSARNNVHESGGSNAVVD